jgi:hypothetical protein
MYRIELAPGEETALRTLDELATGIRNGIITSRARIWHNAGRKWLPIEFHPHYQAALKQLEVAQPPLPGEGRSATAGAPTGAAPAAPMVVAARPGPSVAPFPTPSSSPAPISRPATAPSPAVEKASGSNPATPAGSADRQRSALRPIGLLAGGVVMIVGAQMVASATSPGAEADGMTAIAAATTTPAPLPVPIQAVMAPGAVMAPEATVSPVTTMTPVATSAPSGGVVRGPMARESEVPPLAGPAAAANRPGRAAAESDTLPAIAPAPVIGELSLPASPIDNP